eukprot:maker-scaffold77_size404793-snap-gene-3.29 protein:Tk04785 transcript:maker-scaffold77_size404793-snap-gene-3.29-mRNA-1 annotation:"hypothetical protein"
MYGQHEQSIGAGSRAANWAPGSGGVRLPLRHQRHAASIGSRIQTGRGTPVTGLARRETARVQAELAGPQPAVPASAPAVVRWPVASLEDLCLSAYLHQLEAEASAYVLVTSLDGRSRYLRHTPRRLLQDLKRGLRGHLSGIASSVLRQSMLKRVMSSEFPTPQIYPRQKSLASQYVSIRTNLECPHACCSGSFIRDTMAGVLMSCELRYLVFVAGDGPKLEIPVIFTHFAQSVLHSRVCLLEKLIVAENYLDEESCSTECVSAQSRNQFLRAFWQVPSEQTRGGEEFFEGVEPLHGRSGFLQSLWHMFGPIPELNLRFTRLTEVVLRNNIQCKIYSMANFQFTFLQSIGLACPNLKVLDLFGTDTWADCLVAFFFRDAFHSLHRFLYFYEEDVYHPHNIKRYCQFCLDQNHPKAIERPFTNNPIIPLLDVIYNHVLRKYPKRSYCILRNCIPVSQLVDAPQATVFEILKDESVFVPTSQAKGGPGHGSTTRAASASGGVSSPPAAPGSSFFRAKLRDRSQLAKKSQANLQSSQDRPRGEGWSSLRPLAESERRASPSSPPPPPRRSMRLRTKGRMLRRKAHSVEKERSAAKRTRFESEEDEEGMAAPVSPPLPLENAPPLATEAYEQWKKVSYKCTCRRKERLHCYAHPRSEECYIQVGMTKRCRTVPGWTNDQDWVEPSSVKCREITQWPHLNPCVKKLEVLNIGGTNVLGEFLPFILTHGTNLKSLGQWLNTLIYGIEIMQEMNKDLKLPKLEEFSYSSDRNFFCQPYIGFVPETPDFRNVRKEMLRFSSRVAQRVNPSSRHHTQKLKQVQADMNLIQQVCPNVRKLNLVIHFKISVFGEDDLDIWRGLVGLDQLVDLDLVTVKFVNALALLKAIGDRLRSLVIELDEEQGTGSEIVQIARHCPELRNLRLILGDKVLKGEMTLHFASVFFRHLEHLEIDGAVHLHAFAFLWGHCRSLKSLKMGLVVSNDTAGSNVLIFDVFTLLFQVNAMVDIEEFHIKNLRIRSLPMAIFLLEHMPKLKAASSWIMELPHFEDFSEFVTTLKRYEDKGLKLDFKRW